MRKQLIALVLAFALAALVIACGRGTGTTGYVEPAMEGTTAKAEDCFHSENPHGCESVAYYPSQFFPAKVVGERLTYHSPGFREAQNVRVGIAVVQYDGYLYCVMQGDC